MELTVTPCWQTFTLSSPAVCRHSCRTRRSVIASVMYVHIHTQTLACTNTCMHKHMHAHTCIHAHSLTHACTHTFYSLQDLLNLESESSFEEKFFLFRSTVRLLERRLAAAVRHTFNQCPTLMAELRVLEMFKGMCRRDAVKVHTYLLTLLDRTNFNSCCPDLQNGARSQTKKGSSHIKM